jgi:uncharacterized protein
MWGTCGEIASDDDDCHHAASGGTLIGRARCQLRRYRLDWVVRSRVVNSDSVLWLRLGEWERAKADHAAHAAPHQGWLTFAQWSQYAGRLATRLVDQGVQPSARVLLDFDQGVEFAVSLSALDSIGAVAVSRPPTADLATRAKLLADVGIRWRLDWASTGAWPGEYWLEELADTRKEPAPGPSKTAGGCIVFSSGTTGVPRPMWLSSACLVDHYTDPPVTVGLRDGGNNAPATEGRYRALHAFSPGTATWLWMVLWPLIYGSGVLHAPGASPRELLALAAHGRIECLAVTPALGRALARVADHAGGAEAPIKEICCTGSYAPPSILRELQAAFPAAAVTNWYGASETGLAGCSALFGSADANSVGRVVADGGAQVSVRDQLGRPCAAGTVGEIWFRAPDRSNPMYLTAGGDLEPVATGDGWVRTGDAGYQDEAGSIFVTDRLKDVVKIGARPVSTLQVEGALLSISGVEDAAVVGLMDPDHGEKLAAAVVCDGVATGDLRERLAGLLELYQIPSVFFQLDRIPRSHAGKVNKTALKEVLASFAGTAAPEVGGRSPLEARLCGIFGAVLGESVSPEDSFFGLGGDSLMLTALLEDVRTELGVKLTWRDIVRTPTPRSLGVVVHSRVSPGPGVAQEQATGVPAAGTGPAYRRNSWVDERVGVGVSAISGRGCLSVANIPEGTTVIIWGGVVLSPDDVLSGRAKANTAVRIGEDLFIASRPEDPLTIDGFMNHSCDPNVWLVDEVTLVTRRPLRAGDELTIDYAMWGELESWICCCGSPLCRGRLHADDWRRAELQERYRGHFSPFINARIERARQQGP